jgi:hypothetical protein
MQIAVGKGRSNNWRIKYVGGRKIMCAGGYLCHGKSGEKIIQFFDKLPPVAGFADESIETGI